MIFKCKEIKVMALLISKNDLLPENKMVKYVLLLKIVYTLIGIISYLFLPKSLLISFDIGSVDSIKLIRSLGFAYIGLLFVYSSGYFQIIKKNIYPINVVLFAIFMNGGAFTLSIIYLIIDLLNNIELGGNIIGYAMLFLFFIITLLLIISISKNYGKYKNDIIWNILWKK
jgi:hypothetical protein